jgi:hypothetical protein
MDSVERAVSDVSDEALAAIGGSESVDRFVGHAEKEPQDLGLDAAPPIPVDESGDARSQDRVELAVSCLFDMYFSVSLASHSKFFHQPIFRPHLSR